VNFTSTDLRVEANKYFVLFPQRRNIMTINSSITELVMALGYWLEAYKEQYHDQLERDPEFARWLEEQYIPIAGSWWY